MFAQLDTKSVYSFMDSVVDLTTYIKRAKELGYQALGLMDRDNLYAAYHFAQFASSKGLRPLIGMEANLFYEGRKIPFRLLAKNNQGYKNLMKLATELSSGQREFTAFSDYLNAIALILPSEDWEPGMTLGSEVFIGIRPEDAGKEFDYPVIPLHTVRYFENADRSTIQMLHAISQNVSLSEASICPMNQLLFSPQEMESAYSDIPEALNNLEQLVSDITYQFDTDLKLPRFNRDMPAVDQLRQLAQSGLETKKLSEAVYQERLDKELSIIHQMGFDDYFLIVWDLLRFGRSRGYYMGMGRGSAAGSLVAYVLDITGIDPVKNDLLFERFLNEERYSMPDIDIDLPDIYRSEFLHYVRDRYGSKHSAQIVTFSTFGAKQAIRDVFKRFGAKEFELSQLSKKISFRDTLTSVYEKNMSFRQLINQRQEFQRAFEIAKAIEGQPRQTSIHAAGIVMSDDDLTNHIPLKAGEDMMVTQYDASAVEANGLLKMDFLGLRNLTFVQKMKEKLEEEQGVAIDIKSIDLEDPQTLALFAKGKTKGIFQFEQAGAINLLKRIKPAKFEEVVATTSLNRPGASDYTDNFIARKYGKEKVDLIDPVVAPILEPTYGIMLYQEQVMQIAQKLAGFSMGKADKLRKAMGKKKPEILAKEFVGFRQGMLDNGYSEESIKTLWDIVVPFSAYAFNKAHSAAYGVVSYWTAYLKANYPVEYMAALLTSQKDNKDKLAVYLAECRHMGITVLPPDVNESRAAFAAVGDDIRFGLAAIRNVGTNVVEAIIKARKEKGAFTSFTDFLDKVPSTVCNKRTIDSLIKAGAFDSMGGSRRSLHLVHEDLVDEVIGIKRNEAAGQFDLFAAFDGGAESIGAGPVFSTQVPDVPEWDKKDKLAFEREMLGLYVSDHPLLGIEHILAQLADTEISTLREDEENTPQNVTIAGLITSLNRKTTKNGNLWAIATVEDLGGSIEVMFFPQTYQTVSTMLAPDTVVTVRGKVNRRDGETTIYAQEMTLPDVSSATHEAVTITVPASRCTTALVEQLREVLERHSGPSNVRMTLTSPGREVRTQLDERWRVSPTTALFSDLKAILGPNCLNH